MIKIRSYKADDVFTVAKMLSKLVANGRKELADILVVPEGYESMPEEQQEKDDEKRGIEIALLVFQKCFDGAEGELKKWLASLCDMTEKEFLEQTPETVLEVAEQIITSEESRGFFSNAYQLFKKMNVFGMLTKNE